MARPRLIVVDVSAADDQTALAFQETIATRWATATAERTTRALGDCRRNAARPVTEWFRAAPHRPRRELGLPWRARECPCPRGATAVEHEAWRHLITSLSEGRRGKAVAAVPAALA
ncbi:DUF6207 family protein [Streptomyces sp. NPDC052107]|uniref:DUF6207 family protein n=1 Tax=Streptomyces sp. NPDC052107 TaxID=3155632 RepID=UPI00341E518E